MASFTQQQRLDTPKTLKSYSIHVHKQLYWLKKQKKKKVIEIKHENEKLTEN